MKFSSIALKDWLMGVAQIADGVVCVSRSTADEVRCWMDEQRISRSKTQHIGFFHNGTQLDSPTADASEYTIASKACAARPTFLMVGTVLPYKGYGQALDAIEDLWRRGIDCNLIVVGKEGWRVAWLAYRLRHHREQGKRMYWFESASDGLLVHLYRSASCLLAASEAEGFGLPLIEAARNGLPIVARDIPIFREVARECAYYFSGESSLALSEALSRWLLLQEEGRAPASDRLPWQSWAQSKDQLLDIILNEHWYTATAVS